LSIEVELHRKGGKVCPQAQQGTIKCPLIVRPTSEDVLTGNVFGMLQHIRPHLWLNPLLNQAIDGDPQSGRFHQVWFKDFQIRFWERQARFPPELLDFKEGRTEPDIVIEWENPPTTLWIEVKYLSSFSKGTVHCADNDQISRSIRTLMAETGHIQANRLFDTPLRRALWVAITLNGGEGLSEQCNQAGSNLSLPEKHAGNITWEQIGKVLAVKNASNTPGERSMMTRLTEYLESKLRCT